MSARSKKTAIFATIIILFVGIIGGFLLMNRPTSPDDIETSYLPFCSTIDTNDTAQLVGDADYVFVGTVLHEDTPVYEDDLIYTPYTVDVLENIKGTLKTDTSIPVMKFGGLAKDHSAYYLFEGDALPVTDKTYIFCAYAQEDGSLMVSGARSNIEISGDIAALHSTPAYTEFQDAVKNQIVSDRERFVSVYEEKTGA